MIQALTHLGGVWVRQSWNVASVVLKYVVAFILVWNLYSGFSVEELERQVVETSRYVVYSVAAVGVIVAAAGINVSASWPLFSQVVAFVYFGYLFWIY